MQEFETIFEDFRPMVFRFLLSLCGDEGLAEKLERMKSGGILPQSEPREAALHIPYYAKKRCRRIRGGDYRRGALPFGGLRTLVFGTDGP